MGLDVRACKHCKRMFRYVGNVMCPECVQKLDDDFVKVREYIYDHPKASMQEICLETDVPQAFIMQMLREGRLSTGDDSIGLISCELCGKMIASGQYCDACKNELAKGLQSVLPKAVQEDNKLKSAGKRAQGMHVNVDIKK